MRKTKDGKVLHTFEFKRRVAKFLCQGKKLKEAASEFGIPETTVSDIKRDYVVITLSERYPDGETEDLFSRDWRYDYKIPNHQRPRKPVQKSKS